MGRIDVIKIKLFQLRAVAAVTGAGSFGEAALNLDVTQSRNWARFSSYGDDGVQFSSQLESKF